MKPERYFDPPPIFTTMKTVKIQDFLENMGYGECLMPHYGEHFFTCWNAKGRVILALRIASNGDGFRTFESIGAATQTKRAFKSFSFGIFGWKGAKPVQFQPCFLVFN